MGRDPGRVGGRSSPRSRDYGREPLTRAWPRWAQVAIASVLGAFVALALARYLPSPAFIGALFALAVLVCIALFASIAGVLGRLSADRTVPPAIAAVVSAAAALFGRAALRALLGLGGEPTTVDPVAFFLAALGLTGAVAGVGWGVAALGGGSNRRWGWTEALLATAAIAACLYSLGPILLWLGVPVDHWTFLSLGALGVASFGVVSAFRSRRSR